MNEVDQLKTTIKKLELDFKIYSTIFIFASLFFISIIIKLDPLFEYRIEQNYHYIKGLYENMEEEPKEEIKGIFLEDPDWQTIG